MELEQDQENSNYVKILIKFYSEIMEQDMVETLWAIKVNEAEGIYKLDNIPFYAPLLASEDLVLALYDPTEDRLVYQRTLKDSGNSTIHVVIFDENVDLHSLCDEFFDLGCQYEGVNEQYFAMEVPKSIDYKPVKARLDQLELQGTISYAESCLSELHFEQL